MLFCTNEEIACNSAVVWPASAIIRPTGRGRVVYASGCAITFNGVGVEAPLSRQVFSGFPPGAVQWDTVYPDQISIAWFGGKADLKSAAGNYAAGVLTHFTDNSGPWRAMFDAQAARANDVSSPNVVRVGATSHLPPSVAYCYGFSATPQVTKPGILQGGAHAGWYRHTCLQTPKDRTGLFVNGTNTWLAPYTSGPVNAAFSTIQNLTIIGGNVDDAPTTPPLMAVDVTNARGTCFFMGAFLGTNYDAVHGTNCSNGSFYNPVTAGTGGNTISASYVEDGTPPAVIGQYDLLLHGSGFAQPDAKRLGGSLQVNQGFVNVSNLQVLREYPASAPGTLLRFGDYGAVGTPAQAEAQTVLQFGTTDDPANAAFSGTTQRASATSFIQYCPTGTSYPSFLGWTYQANVTKPAFMISTGAASLMGGTLTKENAGVSWSA